MGDYTAIRTYTYINGALILANENNTNENTIYLQHNAAFNAITGHLHTGAVGDAPKLGPASIDTTANYTWSGIHTFTNANAIRLYNNATLKAYSDAGLTQIFNIGGASGASGLFATGLVGAPSIAFIGNANTGIYRPALNQIAFSLNGTQSFLWTTTYAFSVNPFYLPDGAVGAPGLAFNSNTDLGLFRNAANSLTIVTGGSSALTLSNSSVLVQTNRALLIQAGTVANTGLGFDGDVNTGLISGGADNFSLVTGGSTALTVNNTDVIVQTNRNLQIQAGAVGAPSLYPAGDSNTGLYFPGADQVGIAVNGAAIATFGIGTSTIAGVQIETHKHDLGTTKINFVDGTGTLTQNGIGTNTGTITIVVSGFDGTETADTSAGAIHSVYRNGAGNPEWDGINSFEITANVPSYAAGDWTFTWDTEVVNGDGSEYIIAFNALGMVIADSTGAPV